MIPIFRVCHLQVRYPRWQFWLLEDSWKFFEQIFTVKTNSLPSSKIQYLVTICINSVQNRPNSSWQTEYCSYLVGMPYPESDYYFLVLLFAGKVPPMALLIVRGSLEVFWMNIYGKKQIEYQVQKLSIRPVFISIHFKIDRIVHDRPNIAVT